jgi:3D (Asp-Asp-Asp) domain-containing protein
MRKFISVALVAAGTLCLVSCETTPKTTSRPAAAAGAARFRNVRTTAYTHSEGSSRNAVGRRLSGGGVMSAGSDWSRFPVGTRFRIASTGEEYVIDDYGWALIGTDTIDLYKPSRTAVRQWGVRRIDIEILHWGSEEESLKILRPRQHVRNVRRMIASLESKKRA